MTSYSVLMLGARGAGKTVYLSSMFRRLSTAARESFYLSTTFDTRKELNEIYNQIQKVDGWPDPTQITTEWVFDVKVRLGVTDYDAFKIIYYDYAGGKITEPELIDEKLEYQLEHANNILGLLNGDRLYDFMENIDPENKFRIEMDNICQHLANSKKPVHLLISKWDLFDNKYSLENVCEKLMEHDAFEDFVISRSKLKDLAPARLIPISSLGTGYVVRESFGKMRRVPGAKLQPFQIEMPFISILPDHFYTKEKALEQEETNKNIEKNSVRVTPDLSIWDKIKLGFGNFLEKHYQDNDNLQELAKAAKRTGLIKLQQAIVEESKIKEQLDQQLNLVRNEKSAFEFIGSKFLEMQNRMSCILLNKIK